MATIERSISINASPEEVFGYISDFSRHPEWADVRLKIEQTSEGPLGQGTTLNAVGHQFGRDFEGTVTITEFAPNETLAFESQGNDFHFRHYFLLQREDSSTRLIKATEPQRSAFPFSLILAALGWMILPRGLDGDLKRIKAKLEGEPAA